MMSQILRAGRVAVVTGAASGIGFATVRHLAVLGMKVCLADSNAALLSQAAASVRAVSGVRAEDVVEAPLDVASLPALQRLNAEVRDRFGEVAFLMNNAAIAAIGGPWSDPAAWQAVLGVNLGGVINGLQAFTADMIAQSEPSCIVNVGSKQGITTPPGNAAYNVAKAGVKVLTEQLAYELRQIPTCRVTAHLLIPGYTFTGMTQGAGTQPPGAWSADQVAEYLMAGLAAGDFYVLCPDNQTTTAMDQRRIQWAADDLIRGRPALSRWHPDFADAFAAHMAQR